MTVGLRHVAAAAAFVIATDTVFQHANAQTCDQTELAAACSDDATCNGCVFAGIEDNGAPFTECVQSPGVPSDPCGAQLNELCCYNEVSGLDCVGNDIFWEYLTCNSGIECDDRTCGASGGVTAPPATTTIAPAPTGVETVAPSAATPTAGPPDRTAPTTAPAAAGGQTDAPATGPPVRTAPTPPPRPTSSAGPTAAPTFLPPGATIPPSETMAPVAEGRGETPEPTSAVPSDATPAPSSSAAEGGGEEIETPEPTTSDAERSITITEAPTTAEEANEGGASGVNGAGPGASWSPIGLAVAGLAAVLALVGV